MGLPLYTAVNFHFLFTQKVTKRVQCSQNSKAVPRDAGPRDPEVRKGQWLWPLQTFRHQGKEAGVRLRSYECPQNSVCPESAPETNWAVLGRSSKTGCWSNKTAGRVCPLGGSSASYACLPPFPRRLHADFNGIC